MIEVETVDYYELYEYILATNMEKLTEADYILTSPNLN